MKNCLRLAFGCALILLTSLTHAADPLWQIHNPSPPSIDTLIRAVTGADNRIAALYQFSPGMAATDDGTNWRWERTANPYTRFTDLIYANGQWVTVSSATNAFGLTAIQTSPDLRNWSLNVINTPRTLTHIAFGGGKYWGITANGANSLVYSSTDAATWLPVAGHNFTGTSARDLVYSTNFNRLVASVDNGITNRILTSADGITWTERLALTNGYYVVDLAAANGAVIGVGFVVSGSTTNIFRSTDGVSFTNVVIPGSVGGLLEITYGRTNEWMIMKPSSVALRSTNNGVTWADLQTGYSGNGATALSAITYRPADDRYYSMGSWGFVASSQALTNPWTRVSKGTNANFNGIATGLGRVVAVGNSTNLFLAAAGSTNWVVTNVPNGTFSGYDRVSFINNRFIALSGSTRSARSTDGINFTAAPMNAQVQRILWDGTQYIGTRDNFTNFMFSADAITWTTNKSTIVPFDTRGKLYQFAGKYVYISRPFFGEMAFGVTTNFTTWATNNLQNYFGDFLYDFIEAGGNLYYPFSDGVLKSSDGLNWIIQPTGNSWKPTEAGATVVSNRLYTLSVNPTGVIYSDTGTNWQPVAGLIDPFPGVNSNARIIYDGTRLIFSAQRGTLASVGIALSGAAPTGTSFASWRSQFTFPFGQDDDVDDPDNDRLINIAEFAFGSNPTNGTSGELPKAGTVSEGGTVYPSVSFIRRKDVTGITLDVTAAADVTFGSSVGVTQANGSPQDLGEGLERVIYRTTTPLNALPAVFFNIRVLSP